MICFGGMVFGFILMSLVDVVMYVVILVNLDGQEMVVIQNFNINFFSKFGQVDLIGDVEILCLGCCFVMLEVCFYSDGNDVMVVYVIGIYVILCS